MKRLIPLALILTVATAAAAGLETSHQKFGLREQPDSARCLSCHGGSYEALGQATKASPNPHASHIGRLQCDSCHGWSGPSVVICQDCHRFGSLKLP